jgi:hypothetical protein
MVLNDFLRGKIPWYIPDPTWPDRKSAEKVEGSDGNEEMQDEEDNSSWEDLDIDSGISDEEDSDDEDIESKTEDDCAINVVDEDERIEDPRPSKRVKR